MTASSLDMPFPHAVAIGSKSWSPMPSTYPAIAVLSAEHRHLRNLCIEKSINVGPKIHSWRYIALPRGSFTAFPMRRTNYSLLICLHWETNMDKGRWRHTGVASASPTIMELNFEAAELEIT